MRKYCISGGVFLLLCGMFFLGRAHFSSDRHSDMALQNEEAIARGESGKLGGPEVITNCGHWNPETDETCFTEVTFCSGSTVKGCTQEICPDHQKNHDW